MGDVVVKRGFVALLAIGLVETCCSYADRSTPVAEDGSPADVLSDATSERQEPECGTRQDCCFECPTSEPMMGYCPYVFVHLTPSAAVQDPPGTTLPRDGQSILVLGYWLDGWADDDCVGHCIVSGWVYHVIDISADVGSLASKLEGFGLPPGLDPGQAPIPGTTITLAEEGKVYTTYCMGEGDGDAWNPPTVLETVLTVREVGRGLERPIPLPLR